MAKIMVVDDEESVRTLLDTVLRRKGHDVVLASGGQKAIEAFRRERPSVTILDLKMPDMNGLSVLRQIRTLSPQASVIILSGVASVADEQQARALGVTEFLQKGFSLDLLGEALKRTLKAPVYET